MFYAPAMGDRRVAVLWPRYVQTVGLMRDMNARVVAFCPVCKLMFRVDLEAIIQLRSRSYSLIDQRGPCRQYQCKGKAFFMYSPGDGVPFRPLATEAGSLARIFADEPPPKPDDDPPPINPPPRPPRAPLGVDPAAWAAANEREQKQLIRRARD